MAAAAFGRRVGAGLVGGVALAATAALVVAAASGTSRAQVGGLPSSARHDASAATATSGSGPAGYVVTHAGAIPLPTAGAGVIGSLFLPAGNYLVTARVMLSNAGPPGRARCSLGSDAIDVPLNEGARPASELPAMLVTALRQPSAGSVELRCDATGGRISAMSVSLSAVAVATLSSTTF